MFVTDLYFRMIDCGIQVVFDSQIIWNLERVEDLHNARDAAGWS